MILLCKKCQKEFSTNRKTRIPQFCSFLCFNNWRTGRKTNKSAWNKGIKCLQFSGINHWNWKGGKTFRKAICQNCKKEFKGFSNNPNKFCSNSCKGKYLTPQGKEHWLWKDKNVGYFSLHNWVSRHLGKAYCCSYCFSTQNVEWANKSHEYKRDLKDWIQLCKKCHAIYDEVGKKSWIMRREKYGNSGRRIYL